MRVYKYYPARWGREAILKQRLKVTTEIDINDPFEFRAIGTKDRLLRSDFENWRRDFVSKYGLISFCRNRKNPVIWSHYAESYKGICLGFDIDEEYLNEVVYVAERINISRQEMMDEIAKGDHKRLFSKLLSPKAKFWDYEDEKRVYVDLNGDEIIRENGNLFVPFGGDYVLREIILGPHYKPIKDESLKAELKYSISRMKRCSVKTARLAFQTFDVALQKDKRRHKSL